MKWQLLRVLREWILYQGYIWECGCPQVLLVLRRSQYLLPERLEVLAAEVGTGHVLKIFYWEGLVWVRWVGDSAPVAGAWPHVTACVHGAVIFPIVGVSLISWQTLSWTCQWAGDIGSSDRQGCILSSMATCECGVPVRCVSGICLQQAPSWTSLEIGTPETGKEAGIWAGVLDEMCMCLGIRGVLCVPALVTFCLCQPKRRRGRGCLCPVLQLRVSPVCRCCWRLWTMNRKAAAATSLCLHPQAPAWVPVAGQDRRDPRAARNDKPF